MFEYDVVLSVVMGGLGRTTTVVLVMACDVADSGHRYRHRRRR